MQSEQKGSFVAINHISNANKLSESCWFWTLFYEIIWRTHFLYFSYIVNM